MQISISKNMFHNLIGKTQSEAIHAKLKTLQHSTRLKSILYLLDIVQL